MRCLSPLGNGEMFFIHLKFVNSCGRRAETRGGGGG